MSCEGYGEDGYTWGGNGIVRMTRIAKGHAGTIGGLFGSKITVYE